MGNKILTKIKGVHYRSKETKEFLNGLSVGTSLYLKHEPDNKYDPYAIKVMYLGNNISIHLGYIPKEISRSIVGDMENGESFEVTYKGSKKLLIENITSNTNQILDKPLFNLSEKDKVDTTLINVNELDSYFLDYLIDEK